MAIQKPFETHDTGNLSAVTNETVYSETAKLVYTQVPHRNVEQERAAIWADLKAKQPQIHSKYLYNEAGSKYYEAITYLDEYYPTRTEAKILTHIAPKLTAFEHIVELGSGSSLKTRIVLEAFEREQKQIHYWPIDVSPTILEDTIPQLDDDYDMVQVTGVAGEYEVALDTMPEHDDRLVLFLGGTIGNFSKSYKDQFFNELFEHLQEGDTLLVGFDRAPHSSKPVEKIHKAYNDTFGVTAAFNLNILNHINDIVGSNFDTHLWRHEARFNPAHNQIEMVVICNAPQTVTSPYFDEVIEFAAGDEILTEISRKYNPDDLTTFFSRIGFEHVDTFHDEQHDFGMILLKKAA